MKMKPLRLEIDTCLQDLSFNSIMDIISLKVHDNVFDNVKLQLSCIDNSNITVFVNAANKLGYISSSWGFDPNYGKI